jgi:hypothetical protein
MGGSIPFMFYTNYLVYDELPTALHCQLAKNKGYKIAVLKRGPLPGYIEKDTTIAKIEVRL